MSGTAGPAPTAPTPPPIDVVDERLAEVSLLTRLARRPELGALLAALAVGLFFAAPADPFGTLAGAAHWTDVAAPYHLSAGVMTGTTGLLMGLLATEVGMSIWPAILLTFAFAATVGFLNGLMVVKTRLPSFIVTLATFFIPQGLNLGVTKQITGQVRVGGLSDTTGFATAQDIFGGTFWAPHDFRVSVLWW